MHSDFYKPKSSPRLRMKKYRTYILYGAIGGVLFLLGIVLGYIGGYWTGSTRTSHSLASQTCEDLSLSPSAVTTSVEHGDGSAQQTPLVEAPSTSTPSPERLAASATPELAISTPDQPTDTPAPPSEWYSGPITFGYSFNGDPLVAYRLGNGPSARAIIGGIHGGYERNTVELVSDMLGYLNTEREIIPVTVTLYIIPNMNPDGYEAGTDAVVARMNGNGVDLNRNWDYEWRPEATHGTRPVNAGTAPFSEPETAAVRDFILDYDIELVIFYHSAMGVVFAGAEQDKCATLELAQMLSSTTGYRLSTEGIYGQVTTGDAIDWLSTQGIAGAEIELYTHDAVSESEWEQNLRGLRAFLAWTIPTTSAHDAPEFEGSEYTEHVVKSGETMTGIAERYGIVPYSAAYDAFLSLNGIADADDIRVGDIIRIPIMIEP